MNNNYSVALDSLERRRNQMHYEMTQRTEEIYRKFPQIRNIDEEIRTLGFQAIDYSMKKLTKDAQECVLKQDSLKAERIEILVSNGYPADYTEIRYKCNICKDSGFYQGRVCDCVKRAATKLRQKQFSESSPFPDCRFSEFSLDYYSKQPVTNETGANIVPYNQMENVFRHCKNYADDFSEKSYSLLLTGHSGLGKTHLACSIANAVIEKGYTVLYASAQSLFYKFEQTKYTDSDMLNDILSCDLFILDDLGAETMTNYTQSVLYNIVNTRMMEKKPTIYTTNIITQKQLITRYSEKIASRLLGECTILPFTGDDIRLKKR